MNGCMREALLTLAALCVWEGMAEIPVPPAPDPAEWMFRRELAKPQACHARAAHVLKDGYGLKGTLETVAADLARFFASAPAPATRSLTLAKGAVAGPESHRVDVAANGDVTLTAEDDAGIRRAVYWFEDRNAAGDLAPIIRKPWLKNRISRCYFSPIKRPPFNRDELMDDVDYYPDAYLNRLAHEGVNGLWLSLEWRDLVGTSFQPRPADAARRLAKLRRTVEKCARYGIGVWAFCIEPRFLMPEDPLAKMHPGMLSPTSSAGGSRLVCPSTEEGRRYIEESAADLFTQVPGLAGILNISYGERPTTCLWGVDVFGGAHAPCPRCAALDPWEIHARTAEAFVRGMRRGNPKAEFLSWFYQPHVAFSRAPWVAEIPRHLPDGVTFLYNFESGAVKEQLGRYRAGGDYWLSYVGPSPAFAHVAAAAQGTGGKIGAKIQVACSHECATVPFVPVPGLLYRKYRAMKAAGCSSVMQCWYFGNHPGIMNKAAGELAFEEFAADENAFLRRLAAPEWGGAAETVARLWRDFSDAYADYPLSNDMQYYGPFHAGVVWPLETGVEMKPLARTWKPHDPPSGDVLGECLENHSLEEACTLAARMARRVTAAEPVLARLEREFAQNADRMRDIGVMRALGILFASASDVFDFYRHRACAVAASRMCGDAALAQNEIEEMRSCVIRAERHTSALLPLARADSRLGFHSEAETHQFHPAKLVWRLAGLADTRTALDGIAAEIAQGRPYPLSPHERTAAALVCGSWTATTREFQLERRADRELDEHHTGTWIPASAPHRFRASFARNGDFVLEGDVPNDAPLDVRTFDVCGVTFPKVLTLAKDGTYEIPAFNVVTPGHVVRRFETTPRNGCWSFRLVLDSAGWGGTPARRPGWICFRRGAVPIWPEVSPAEEERLNLGNITPLCYGRIVSTEDGVGASTQHLKSKCVQDVSAPADAD